SATTPTSAGRSTARRPSTTRSADTSVLSGRGEARELGSDELDPAAGAGGRGGAGSRAANPGPRDRTRGGRERAPGPRRPRSPDPAPRAGRAAAGDARQLPVERPVDHVQALAAQRRDVEPFGYPGREAEDGLDSRLVGSRDRDCAAHREPEQQRALAAEFSD